MSFILIFHDWRGIFLFVRGVWGLQLGCVSLLFANSDQIGIFKPRTF